MTERRYSVEEIEFFCESTLWRKDHQIAMHKGRTIIRQLLGELGEARENLKRYGKHDPSCATVYEPTWDCTCGLAAAKGE